MIKSHTLPFLSDTVCGRRRNQNWSSRLPWYVRSCLNFHSRKFSTISPEELQIFCAWQESSPLNQTGSDRMKYIPLFLYSFRWNIEISYYEQKTFWSLCSYMVRSCKGIEMMINLINVAYCAMKLLPYQDESFSDFRDKSVQDFRFALSEGIRQQVFFATLVQNIETQIKSSSIINALKQAIVKQEHYL